MTRAGRSLARACRFVRDEAGSVLVLWIMSLVAVLGLVALIFDMGRVQVTHGELQSFADSVALVAAGELDGGANAIERATAAAAEVADTNVYGGDGTLSGAGDYTLTFLTGLPADDTADPSGFALTPDSSGNYSASDDAAAVMVRVEVTPVTVGVNFLAATRALTGVAGGATMPMEAEAIAGFTMEACDITPLMFCMPSPTWTAKANIGQNILLRSGGNGAQWLSGAFGFLKLPPGAIGPACSGVPPNNKPKVIGCVIGAETNRTQCFSQRSVDAEPGQSSGLFNDVFNIRFDRFPGDLKGYEGDANFTVAPNIVSGQDVNCSNWQTPDSTNTVGLPKDTCFGDPAAGTANTCNSVNGGIGPRFGDGNWDYDTYIDTNYGDGVSPLQSSEDPIASHIPTAWAGTRYGVYLGEIEYAKTLNGGAAGPFLPAGRDETGYAQCGGVPSTDPERRVVIAAGVDCSAFATDTSNNDKTNLRVLEFVEMFMLGPVGTGSGTPPGFDISVEVVGSAGESGYGSAGSGGIFRDVVQLYR